MRLTPAPMRPHDVGIGRLFDSIRDAVIVADAETGQITLWNQAAATIFGYTPDEALGLTVEALIPEHLVELHRAGLARYRDSGHGRYIDSHTLLELPALRKGGEEIEIEMSLGPLYYPEDGRRLALAIIRDITASKRAREALRQSEANLAAAQRIARIGSWEWDIASQAVYWSDEMYRLYGAAPGAFVPTAGAILERIHPDDREPVERSVRAAVAEGKPYDLEHRIVLPDGAERVVHTQGEVTLDDAGRPVRMVGSAHDITERKALEDQLRYRAFHDALTDLPNRALFLDRLEQALARTTRDRDAVAVLFLDLDQFKVVNDSLGHAAGDRLLVTVAERFTGHVRPGDSVARFGGDEFAVLLEHVATAADAVVVAERLAECLREPVRLEGRELFVSASVGIAVGSAGRSRPEDLLRDADIAMYWAKQKGRARYQVFQASMYTRAVRRLELEGELRRAIARQEFALHYQPKVELATGKVVGVEALLRWPHPAHGFISPAEFIPLAEETGLILPLGRWVLAEACRQLASWRAALPGERAPTLCVNLSARQFQHSDLPGEVLDALRTAGVEPRCLCLEITESVAMEDAAASVATLRRLKALGVELAIDDFGTGYSSLRYLKQFPVDLLKIDRSFVSGLGGDAEDTAIVRLVTMLARTLGIEAVAEGVETAEQVDQLLGLGCTLAQGYYFARPLPADAVGPLLGRALRPT